MDHSYLTQIKQAMTVSLTGSVMKTVGTTVAVAGFAAPIGALAEIDRQTGPPIEAEVIGFHDDMTILFPFQDLSGVRRGNQVRLTKTRRTLHIGDALLGRVINAHGKCIDGKPQPLLSDRTELEREPPISTERPRIDTPLSTGIRVIDSMLTCGRGQRLGIFAGSGVGKSVLLGMMSKYSDADVIVIGLIGERGREVNEFIERDLGPAGLKRSVVVVATSNEPALMRMQAAYSATSIAEYFRDQGKNVLLLIDSITRFAMAQREIGLAAGEPPTTRGYPPSVFALLPKLVERAGRNKHGSITAYYSVLVEGDDPNEPIADTVRGLIDGHVWLSRKIAARGHYPAVDVLESISRLMTDLSSPEQLEAVQTVRKLLSIYNENEDLISIGAYRQGSNPLLDTAITMREPISMLLQQKINEEVTVEQSRDLLMKLATVCQQQLNTGQPAQQAMQPQ